jgi:hypothetical protein
VGAGGTPLRRVAPRPGLSSDAEHLVTPVAQPLRIDPDDPDGPDAEHLVIAEQ